MEFVGWVSIYRSNRLGSNSRCDPENCKTENCATKNVKFGYRTQKTVLRKGNISEVKIAGGLQLPGSKAGHMMPTGFVKFLTTDVA